MSYYTVRGGSEEVKYQETLPVIRGVEKWIDILQKAYTLSHSGIVFRL